MSRVMAENNDAALQSVKQESAGDQAGPVAPIEGKWIRPVWKVSGEKLTRCVKNRKNRVRECLSNASDPQRRGG